MTANEARRRRQASVEKQCRNDRFHGIGQNRRVGPTAGCALALRQPEKGAEADGFRHLSERLATNERIVAHRERTRVSLVIVGQQEIGNDEAEHPVTEELEPLKIVVGSPPLRHRARMGKGLRQQVRPLEGMPQQAGEPLDAEPSITGLVDRQVFGTDG